MPLISIVTPSFNQAQFLGQAIESVRSQCCKHEIEHLVLDAGSSDGSSDVLERHSDWLAYWKSEPDSGQSAAINKGFDLAKGDILCWINSDDGLALGAASAMIDAIGDQSQPAWGIGQCMVINARDETIGQWKPDPSISLEFLVKWSRNYIMQPAVFWNRRMWDVAGPLREDLHYAMDFDVWLRFIRVSDPVVIQRPVGVHRSHGATKTSLVGRRIFDEYRIALQTRVGDREKILQMGLAEVAKSASHSANASMYSLQRGRCLGLLHSALMANPLAFVSLNYQKALLKLINPLQPDKTTA